MISRSDGFFNLRSFENTSNTSEAMKLNSRKDRSGPALKIIGVRRSFDDHLVPGLGVGFDGQLIGHGPRWYEEGGLLAE
jgi:hypothetical protein